MTDHEPWAAVAETHTAAVFFTGLRAVKVKKPIDFGFVNFRDVTARRHACVRELELNRRLAPDVYLGLVDLVGEPAIVMRRMPSRCRLSTLVSSNDPRLPQGVREVARVIAAFHERCDVHDGGDSPGNHANVRLLWQREISEAAAQGASVFLGARGDEVRRCVEQYLAGRSALFEERVRSGRVRDGHGDLLADDVFVLPDGPRILDCLEFDDRLRIGDVLLDIAFLAMDLERLGAPQLARQLLDDYREFSAETHPASLEHFYIAYRAHIRAKVAVLRALQGDKTALRRADDLMELCVRHLRAATVHLVLVGGLPGAGKSTVARELARRRGWVYLNSDVIRKELAGIPGQRSPAAFEQGLYTPAMSTRTYDELLQRARIAVCRGESVVLDASWRDAAQRAAARALASSEVAVVSELACVAPDAVAEQRLRRRTADPSDADPRVRRQMANGFADWPEALMVTTDTTPQRSVAAALVAIGKAA